MSKIIDLFTDAALFLCGGIEWIAVVLVSMIPMVELKGGIPVGVKLGMGYPQSFLFAFIGSSLVCIPVYFIFRFLFHFKFFNRVEMMIRNKAKSLFNKTKELEQSGGNNKKITWYKILGVFIFVAIPVPLTGVWTGTLVAVLIGLRFTWSVLAIVVGNAVAGGLILLLTYLLGDYIDYFLLGLFAVILVLGIIVIWKLSRPTKQKAGTNEIGQG
jgi:uncharacterized membrane protein